MKKISVKSVAVLLALGMGSVMAEELPMNWIGQKGGASEPPTVVQFASQDTPEQAAADGEKAIGVTVIAVADGAYQKLGNNFNAPIDLSKYAGISFDLRQNVYPKPVRFAIVFSYARGSILTNFASAAPGEWKHVEILFEKDVEWTNLGKYGFGKALGIMISPERNLDTAGESFSIANVELIEK